MKKLLRNPMVILMALLPIAASAVYILILGTAIKDVYLRGIPIVRPLEKISVLGIAMLAGTLVCWGFVGAFSMTTFTSSSVTVRRDSSTPRGVYPLI